MRAKNNLLMTILILGTISNVSAQTETKSKFYVKAFGGYGVLSPGSYKLTSVSDTTFSSGKTGMGQGLHFGGGIGFTVNDFLNLGVDAEYLKGAKLTAGSINNSTPGFYSSSKDTVRYTILSIIPNITFKALSKPSYFIYTRIGIIITATTNSSFLEKDSFPTPTPIGLEDQNARTNSTKFNYNVNLGVQAALGIQFRVVGNLRGFVELVGNYLPVSPSSSDLSSFTVKYNFGSNAIISDNSNNPTKSHTNYVQAGNTTSNEAPKMVFNVNYIGLNLGLAFRF